MINTITNGIGYLNRKALRAASKRRHHNAFTKKYGSRSKLIKALFDLAWASETIKSKHLTSKGLKITRRIDHESD